MKQNIYDYLIQPNTSGFSAFNWVFTAEDFRKELAVLLTNNPQNDKLQKISQTIKDAEPNFSTFDNKAYSLRGDLYSEFLNVSKQIVENLVAKKYGTQMIQLENEPGKFETYLTGTGKFITICHEDPFSEPDDSKLAIKGSLLDKLNQIAFLKSSENNQVAFFRNNGKSIFLSNFAGYKQLQLKLTGHASSNHQENSLSQLIKAHHDKLSTRQLIQELMVSCKDQNLDGNNLAKIVLQAIKKEKLLDDVVFVKKDHHLEKIKISDFIKNYEYNAKINCFYHVEMEQPGVKQRIMFAANKKQQNSHTIILPGEDGYKKLLNHNAPKPQH